MPQILTREDLAFVLDETISVERFAALYRAGLRVIRSGYRGDPEAATPEATEVIAGVLTGVLARIVANPRGARQLNAGGAGLTFGGSDQEVRHSFTLTEEERSDLAYASMLNAGTTTGGAFSIRPGA